MTCWDCFNENNKLGMAFHYAMPNLLNVIFMKKLILFVISVCFFAVSCTDTNNQKMNLLDFQLSYDTLFVKNKLDPIFNVNGPKPIDIKLFNDTLFLYYKTAYNDSLYMYYKENKEYKSYKDLKLSSNFDNDSLNKYGKSISISVLNKDSIFFMQEKYMTTYDLKHKKCGFQMAHNQSDTDNVYFTNLVNPIIWNSFDKKMYSEMVRFGSEIKSAYGTNYLNTELCAQVDPSNGKVEYIPIKLVSELFKTKTLNKFLLFTLNEKKLVSCFSELSEFYVYDIETKEIKTIPFINPDNNEVTEMSSDSIIFDEAKKSSLESFYYNGLIFNEYKKQYILFYWRKMDEKNKKGLFNTQYDKEFAFLVLDEEYNYLGNIIIDSEGAYPCSFYPTKEGLIVLYLGECENCINFMEIKYETL